MDISSDESSILGEQLKKLYQICDGDDDGLIGKNDLRRIADLVPKTDMIAIMEKMGEKQVNECEFYEILKSVVEPPQEHINMECKNKQSSATAFPQLVEQGLAEELAIHIEKPLERPAEKISEQTYDVENDGRRIQAQEMFNINNPLFRPIQPEFQERRKISSLADELSDAEKITEFQYKQDSSTPDRIFKVVFVGDSAVGKTCFLHRFCHNRFKPLFNATIGVDFTVKTLRLSPSRSIAMQLWDTAGQERFRSITRQYFRKADGVILMFDVTSEQSFLNVRNWIESVRSGVDSSSVMCLVGNKADLFGNDSTRNSVYRAGEKLAKEFGMPFFETSAYTGYGIENCMKEMAEKLQKREDDHLEEALRLDLFPAIKKRSWCCI